MEQKNLKRNIVTLNRRNNIEKSCFKRQIACTIKSKINFFLKYTGNSTINFTLEIWYIKPNIFPCTIVISDNLSSLIEKEKSFPRRHVQPSESVRSWMSRPLFLRGRWSGRVFPLDDRVSARRVRHVSKVGCLCSFAHLPKG